MGMAFRRARETFRIAGGESVERLGFGFMFRCDGPVMLRQSAMDRSSFRRSRDSGSPSCKALAKTQPPAAIRKHSGEPPCAISRNEVPIRRPLVFCFGALIAESDFACYPSS